MLASSSSSASSASSDTQSGQESSLAGQRSSTASSSSSSPAIKPLAFDLAQLHNFPSLLHFADPVLDAGETVHRPATASNPFPSSYTIYNDPQHYDPTPPSAASLVLSSGGAGGGGEEVNSETYLASVTPLSAAEVRALHRYTITVNRVVHMTTKGKDASMYALVITGNGQGLVGYGEGKDINASKANRKAFHAAVKSMDFVERYEERSVWGEVEGKWGATRVVMRPRPSGECTRKVAAPTPPHY